MLSYGSMWEFVSTDKRGVGVAQGAAEYFSTLLLKVYLQVCT